MTARRACPSAPGPLEEYVASFDGLFASLARPGGASLSLTLIAVYAFGGRRCAPMLIA